MGVAQQVEWGRQPIRRSGVQLLHDTEGRISTQKKASRVNEAHGAVSESLTLMASLAASVCVSHG